jgi:hypothetical protein
MKKLLLFLIILVAGMALPLQAQAQQYEDVVYLKNSSIIRGIIIEQIPNELLKIKTREENVFVYKMEEVEKITKELSQQKRNFQFSSQKQENEDVVYLKNGSIIRGIIVEQIPNVSIKIKTREENVFIYKMDEVEKITKELQQNQPQKQFTPKDYSKFNKPTGYMGLLEFEAGLGFHYANRFSISFINGYRIIPEFAFGFGIGTRAFFFSYDTDYGMRSQSDWGFPFFLHLRSDFLATRVSPYIAFNIGYNLSLGNYYCNFGGILLEPSFGVGFNIGNKGRMNIGLVFPINRVQYRYYSSYNQSTYVRRMDGAINLKIGFSF